MLDHFEVDTAKVREVARKIRAVAEQVRELSTQDVRAMQSLAESELRGSTATALQEMLAELSGDIKRIANGLKTVDNALTTYARKIEIIDAQMADKIGG